MHFFALLHGSATPFGSLEKFNAIAIAWHTSGFKTLEDAKRREMPGSMTAGYGSTKAPGRNGIFQK